MEVNKISPAVLKAKQRFSIIGNSPALVNAIERALQVAPIDLSVLIIGESGAGKEFFPNIIHENSARKHNKYIAVNCGAIPEGTIDSELFGHEKGAFTGAITSRKGYFEEANGGTIFLDEVAELPLTTQARLLRVLESGEYLRVGSSEVQKTDIRVVAATNRDMVRAVKEGKFREDLFYRLSTVQINIPPLRDRGDDILLLTRKFKNDFAESYRTPAVEFDDHARQALLRYRWPGNVRQLKNVIEQIALFEAGHTVNAEAVRNYLPATAESYTPAIADQAQFSYTQERELLFKLIFQLQDELKNVKELLASTPHNHTQHRKLQNDVHFSSSVDELKTPATTQQLVNYQPQENVEPIAYTPYQHTPNQVHDITASEASDVTEFDGDAHSLDEIERISITKALERNGGKRKKTAEELNISERTLYRKIKEYGL